MAPLPTVSFFDMTDTNLGYSSDRDRHAMTSVHFIAFHIQSQSVQGNPVEGSRIKNNKKYRQISFCSDGIQIIKVYFSCVFLY